MYFTLTIDFWHSLDVRMFSKREYIWLVYINQIKTTHFVYKNCLLYLNCAGLWEAFDCII